MAGNGIVRARERTWWLGILTVAILFTLIQIQFSFERGRLVTPPMYDDVSYFNDALARIDGMYAKGWTELLREYVRRPPHSPYSTGMSMLGFLLFGIRDWAPAACNTLLLIALIGCADYLMSGTRVWQRMMAWIFVLSAPLAGVMVGECRPDCAWGLAAAMTVIVPLRRRFLNARIGHYLVIGAWFTAALLIKPSIFPLTMLSGALAWALAAVCDRLIDPASFSIKRTAIAWAWCCVPVILVAVPHYALNGRNIVAYTFSTAVGSGRAVAVLPGGGPSKADYFLRGIGGVFILDRHLHIALAAIAVGLGVLALRAPRHGDDRARLLRAACLGFITFVAYLVPTMVGLGNPFFGAEFQTLLLLGAVMSAAMIVVHSREWGIWFGGNLPLVALAVAGLVLSRGFPPDWNGNAGKNYNATIRAVAALVVDRAPAGSTTFVTATGWLNSDTLHYLARQQGKDLAFTDSVFSDKLADQNHGFDEADLVLAGEPGVGEFNNYLPSSKILAESLAAIRARPDFHEVGSVRSETGRWFYLFGRTPKFLGWENARNVSAEEGPYPDWHLPIVRWAFYPEATTKFTAPVAGTYHFAAVGRTPVGGQVITVTLDGRPVGTHPFARTLKFESMDFAFEVAPGEHEIAVHFSAFAPNPFEVRQWGALFEQLQLIPPSASTPTTHPSSP